jgi:hypothetical protein
VKSLKYLASFSVLVLLCPVGALARDKNEQSVNIPDRVLVAGTQLQPGTYHVTWQGEGSNVQVRFLSHGKTIATAPATLKMNDRQVIQDDIVIDNQGSPHSSLTEIDFKRDKEALLFAQNAMK